MQCDEYLGLGGIYKLIFPGWSWVTWHMRLWEDLWSSVFWCAEMQQGMILHTGKNCKRWKMEENEILRYILQYPSEIDYEKIFIEKLYC